MHQEITKDLNQISLLEGMQPAVVNLQIFGQYENVYINARIQVDDNTYIHMFTHVHMWECKYTFIYIHSEVKIAFIIAQKEIM